jgi:exodeoxyribonuclease III
MRTSQTLKPLVWMGDLNVTLQDADVTDPQEQGDRGVAGFTPAERGRFGELLAAGQGLVDAWRELHPVGAEHTQSTWTVCAYINAHLWGMRMDYTLVSTSLATRIAAATILGRIDRGVGHGFYGSDHCPIMLELSEADGAEGEAADAAGGHGEAEDGAAAAPEEYSDEDDELRRLRENTP